MIYTLFQLHRGESFLEENTGIFGENYRPTNVPQTNDKPDQLYGVHLTTILRSRP